MYSRFGSSSVDSAPCVSMIPSNDDLHGSVGNSVGGWGR